MNVHDLPGLNAALNATSGMLLVAGYVSIRGKRVAAHIACMMLACLVSAAFLVSYAVYHAQVGSVPFTGTGASRPAYFTILITHAVLAVVIVPLALRTVYLAARRRLEEHRALSRWTLPLWLYVSVTGVVVYWMLYRVSWR